MLMLQAIFVSIALGVITLVCLAHGVFLFKDSRVPKMRPTLMAIFGIALCLGAYALCNQLEKNMQRTASSMRNPPTIAIQDLPAGWETNASLAERAEYSRSVAQRAFVEANVIRDYYDEYGLKHPYEPTQFDRAERELRLAKIANFEDMARFLSDMKWFWLFWPMVGAVLGGLPLWRKVGNFLEARLGYAYS